MERQDSSPSKIILSIDSPQSSQQWLAELSRAESVIDERNRMLYLVAEILDPYQLKSSNKKPPLRVGSFVSAKIIGKKIDNVFRVPQAVIQSDNSVWIINKNGQLHRLGGPARTLYRQDGNGKWTVKRAEYWFKNGLKHRENRPAWIRYYEDGSILDWEEWYKNDKLHREDGPAEIRYHDDGSIVEEGWYKNGQQHREDGPARIRYFLNGSIEEEVWYKNGKWHREDGPAVIQYDEDGSIYVETWYKNWQRHREDAPAVIKYNEDGSIEEQAWFEDGESMV